MAEIGKYNPYGTYKGPKQTDALPESYKQKTGVSSEGRAHRDEPKTATVGPTLDLQKELEESRKSEIDLSAAGGAYPKVKNISDSTKTDKQKMQNALKNLETELKDYLKQAKVLIKENKTDDYKKMFEKMNAKLNEAIEVMQKDYPGQTKIIEHLKEWRTQITKQFMMAVPQQPQEVKQHTITIE